MNYGDYIALPAGAARVVDQGARFSDGTTALRIHNFTVDERGNLDSTFHIRPLIGPFWCGNTINEGLDPPLLAQPNSFTQDDGVIGMCFARFDGLVPQVIFVTSSGIYRYAPWYRSNLAPNGALEELVVFSRAGEDSVVPIGKRWYPPQFEQVGNRVYITLGDGGRAWVWDGYRLRPFGIVEVPHAPMVSGPSSSVATGDNQGGFSVKGRVGSSEIYAGADTDRGGCIMPARYEYAVVLENADGAYSATSSLSDAIRMTRQFFAADDSPDDGLRRFWLREIAKGVDGTAARILLRTHNLENLPAGTTADLYFLHRMPSNIGSEWIDDIPDGELGPPWEHRDPAPQGFYFMSWLNGSMFCIATDGNPCRAWWSEQGAALGPVPESFMQGHWRDIYPGTGPVRGVHKARLPSSMEQPCILVFKERAVHYIAGNYPEWDVGTLHEASGLCGPNLVQSCPDGSIVWFGSGTFWRMDNQGAVADIGATVREDLARVNQARSAIGSSYHDGRRGEVRFFVALDDSETCNYQFIWDYRFGGWRTAETVEASATLRIEEADITLVAGDFDGLRTVFALNRTYPHYEYTHPTAVFQTGWVLIPPSKRAPLHSTWIPRSLLLTLEERAEGTATVEAYIDWDDVTVVAGVDDMPLTHPENTVPFYSDSTTSPADPAEYGTDVWRRRRAFSLKEPIDTGSTESLSISIEASTPFCLVGMDVHGAMVAPPGGRTPQEDG